MNEKPLIQEEYNLDKELLFLYNENEKLISNNMESTLKHYIPSYLSSTYNDKRNWTEDEDRILMSYIQCYNSKNWKKISEIIKTKTSQQCVYRYNKLLNQHKEIKWNRSEDIKLMELIEKYGFDWDVLSQQINKPADAIKDRFYKKLDPNLKRSKFSEKEDMLIYKLHNKYGNKWNEISSFFPDRNASMIKNRYYSYIRKKYYLKKNFNLNISVHSESESYGCSSSKISSTNNYGTNNNISPIYFKTQNNIKIEKNLQENNENLNNNDYNNVINLNNLNQVDSSKTAHVNDDLGFSKNYNLVIQNNESMDESSKNNICNSNVNNLCSNNLNHYFPNENMLQKVNPFINNSFFENTRKNSNFFANYPNNDEYMEDLFNTHKKQMSFSHHLINNDFNVDIFFDNEIDRKNKNSIHTNYDSDSNHRLFPSGYNNIINPVFYSQVLNCFNKEEQEFLCNEQITDKQNIQNNFCSDENSRIMQELKTVYNAFSWNRNVLNSNNIQEKEYFPNQNEYLDNLYERLLEFYLDRIRQINLSLSNY